MPSQRYMSCWKTMLRRGTHCIIRKELCPRCAQRKSSEETGSGGYPEDAVNTPSSLEFIANPGYGEDDLRFFGSLLQFLAQAGNVHIDGARERTSFVAPHLAQDFITRKSDSFALYEIAQELKFSSRKINRSAFSRNLSAANVHSDCAKLENSMAG